MEPWMLFICCRWCCDVDDIYIPAHFEPPCLSWASLKRYSLAEHCCWLWPSHSEHNVPRVSFTETKSNHPDVSELTGNSLACNREHTEDVLGSEISLMDVQLSHAVYRPTHLKKVCCTLLNVNERSSRWFIAAIGDSFLCCMTSPLLTDRCISGHISAESCTIPDTVLPLCWNSVFVLILPDHLTWQGSSDLFKKQISIWLILNDSHEWLLFVIRFVLGFLFIQRCFHSVFAGTPVGWGDGCRAGS